MPFTERSDSLFLHEIRRPPLLEAQDEYVLAKSWREQGDQTAAHTLVTSHLRLVAKIARGYRGYGLPVSDMISEGSVGLMQAVRRFEPEKGFRLATYATWWIKAAIHEYILRSWSLVRIGTTANQKKLFFNLCKAKSRISALQQDDMRPDQVAMIAKRLGVPEQDVIDMNRRLSGDISLNASVRADADSGEWQDLLVDDRASQESALADIEESDIRRKALSTALLVLNERERRIFAARRLADDAVTLEGLAGEFGVSPERVSQIEQRAFEKIRIAVKKRVAAMERETRQGCRNAVVRRGTTSAMTAFVAVAKKGALAAADRHLSIAPTSITQQLRCQNIDLEPACVNGQLVNPS
jgi:RNA polymerase sigma-32 factor